LAGILVETGRHCC